MLRRASSLLTRSLRSFRFLRQETAYRNLLLLRSAMAVLNFGVRKESVRTLPELNGAEKNTVQRNLLIHPENQHYAIDENTEFEENIVYPF